MKKRFLALMLAAVMVLSAFTGCKKTEDPANGGNTGSQPTSSASSNNGGSTNTGDNGGSTNSGEVSEVIILYPGEETDAMTNFINNQLNPRLADEVGIKVKMIYKGWDVYWDQKAVLLNAKEPIDLYWDGLPDLSTMVNNQQAQPIGNLIKENCPDMLKVIPESQLAGGVVDGVQYGIPSAYAPSSCMFQLVCVRQDILEGVGMSDIKTADDLKTFAQKAADQYPEMNGPADIIFKPLTRNFASEQYTWIAAGDAVVYGEDTQKAYCYFETDAFKQVAKFNQSMYAEGLYRDELTTNYNERDSRMQQGTYLWVEGSLGKENEIIASVRQQDPNAKLKSFLLNPTADKYITACGGEVLCVPYSAQNPAGAMKFLNWLYKSQENYLFCLYGPEGENYTVQDGRIVLNDPGFEGYFYEWMFRNANYTMFTSDVTDDFINRYENWDSNAKTSDVIAFHFNNENVREIETAITEVVNQRFTPIECGFVDFDSNYDAAVQELKDAGIDQYVAEVQKQLDEFFKVNGHNH
ncbi:MAG: ABC transporter substrate-binding protein [Lachnospiraceae bacterium]|nr:ABC transporter substrate-binding protein [Lachnospiraceae bacterium]